MRSAHALCLTVDMDTAGWITKCRNGHARRWTDAQRADAVAPWDHSKHGGTACPVCDVCVKFAPIRVRVTRTDCGPRCTSAMGPSCDCTCGGANHAADHAA